MARGRGGLAQSELATQLRVNIKDGGVDTQVRAAVPGDKSGWFGFPTCWQFKAVDAAGINVQKEIHKPYVEELIRQAHAYRLCILGDLTPEKLEELEAVLKDCFKTPISVS